MNLVPLQHSPRSRIRSSKKWIPSLAAAAWLLAGCGGGGDQSPAASANTADVATAKAFFANLRANAAALQSGVTDTGIADGVNAFGATLQTSAASAATSVADSIRARSDRLRLVAGLHGRCDDRSEPERQRGVHRLHGVPGCVPHFAGALRHRFGAGQRHGDQRRERPLGRLRQEHRAAARERRAALSAGHGLRHGRGGHGGYVPRRRTVSRSDPFAVHRCRMASRTSAISRWPTAAASASPARRRRPPGSRWPVTCRR